MCSKTNQVAHNPTPISSKVDMLFVELVAIKMAGIAKNVILAKH